MRFNAGPFAVDGVEAMGAVAASADASASASASTAVSVPAGVTVHREGDAILLENAHVAATLDGDGLLVSLRDRATGREAIPAGRPAKVLQLFRDIPTQWDAWDIDAHYVRSVVEVRDAESIEIVRADAVAAEVRIVRRFGDSSATETVALRAGDHSLEVDFDIDWRERQKLLKLAFPLDVHADHASSEIQFGHVRRPTHANTSWDVARFETVAHRWIHVGEHGYGVAIANDSTYGHDARRSTDPEGSSVTTVRLSLLRSPLYPDPESDQGRHRMRVSIVPGASIPDAVAEGYRMNLPLRALSNAGTDVDRLAPLVRVDGAVVECVKLAEDRSGDVIVRLYEPFGGRAQVRLAASFDAEAWETDLLERRMDEPRVTMSRDVGRAWRFEVRPFQLVTVRLRRE